MPCREYPSALSKHRLAPNVGQPLSQPQGVSFLCFLFFSSRRRHTRCSRDWSSDVCSSDLKSLPFSLRCSPFCVALQGHSVIAYFCPFWAGIGSSRHVEGVPGYLSFGTGNWLAQPVRTGTKIGLTEPSSEPSMDLVANQLPRFRLRPVSAGLG